MYLNDLDNYGEVRVVEIHLVVKVTILDHHTSHQLNDLISVHITVVTSLVVDSKLEGGRERERDREGGRRREMEREREGGRERREREYHVRTYRNTSTKVCEIVIPYA